METADVLAMLNELETRRELFIGLTPPFSVSLEIDREVLREALLERGGVTRQSLDTWLTGLALSF